MSEEELELYVCPECVMRKHGNCNGEAWDFKADKPTTCACPVCEDKTG